MTQRRFTIACEFRGGTYISQVLAPDEVRAIEAWAQQFERDRPIPRSSAHVALSVRREVAANDVSALTGLTGVWCISAAVAGDLVLGSVVLSASD